MTTGKKNTKGFIPSRTSKRALWVEQARFGGRVTTGKTACPSGKEPVLADSGWAGEITPGVGGCNEAI
jgi:hypothetical protein